MFEESLITSSRRTKMRHRVRVENPPVTSMAAGVLLSRSLEIQERSHWVSFRLAFLGHIKAQQGHLECHYCHCKGLVAELPDDATRADLKHLATLDHVVPRSQGGAEYDGTNLVVACHPCNQKKGNRMPNEFPG